MGLDFGGLGFGNDKVNWNHDCCQYRESLYSPHLDLDLDYFSAGN